MHRHEFLQFLHQNALHLALSSNQKQDIKIRK